jgi:Scabin-like
MPWGEDMDLMGHADGTNHATSGYASTSLDSSVARRFGPNVYAIRAPGGVDVNHALGADSPFPEEVEIAMPAESTPAVF